MAVDLTGDPVASRNPVDEGITADSRSPAPLAGDLAEDGAAAIAPDAPEFPADLAATSLATPTTTAAITALDPETNAAAPSARPLSRGGEDPEQIAAERKKSFRQARRHSWLVRVLKLIFPVSALALFGFYGVVVSLNTGSIPARDGNIDIGTPTVTRDGVAMLNPKYEGFNDDGSTYVVTAKQAFPDFSKPDVLKMNDISGTLTQPGGNAPPVQTFIKAKRGIFDNKKSELDLKQFISIRSSNGLTAQLNSAKVYIKGNKIVTSQPVAAQMPSGTIRANAMTLLTKKRQAAFTGGVAVNLTPEPPKQKKPVKTANATKAKSSPTEALKPANSGGPIKVVAMRLDVDDNKRIAIFKERLRVTQGGGSLTAQELQVEYQGSAALPGQAPKRPARTAANKSNADKTNAAKTGGTKLKRVIALRNVVMTAADGRRATGDRAEFDAASDTAVLTGNVMMDQGAGKGTAQARRAVMNRKTDRIVLSGDVVMSQGPGKGRATAKEVTVDRKADTVLLTGKVVMTQKESTVKGDRVFLNRKEDTALLTGDVILTQARNRLSGGRLFVNQKNGTSRLTNPNGAKRILATFYQNPPAGKAAKKKAKPGKAAEAGKAVAGGSAFSVTQFKSDPNAPIKIDANQLDVNDKAKSAIFTGNVVAGQGDMTMRTAKLIATYTGESGMGTGGGLLDGLSGGASAPPVKKKSKSKKPKQQAELKRIEARQKVEITSKDGRSATGDWADFDVKANTMILGGNVVLKQGSTVILGDKLLIDMTTGRTRIVPRKGGTAGVGQAGGGSNRPRVVSKGGRACPPGRTCLQLIPGQLQEQAKSQKGGNAGGWGSSTTRTGKKNKKRKSKSSRARKNAWEPSSSASQTYRSPN